MATQIEIIKVEGDRATIFLFYPVDAAAGAADQSRDVGAQSLTASQKQAIKDGTLIAVRKELAIKGMTTAKLRTAAAIAWRDGRTKHTERHVKAHRPRSFFDGVKWT